MNILFVCAGNANRSPTCEIYFRKRYPEHEYKSSGTYFASVWHLDTELLMWADIVFLMDLDQERYMARSHPEFVEKTHVIGISDQYDYNDPALIRLLDYWVSTGAFERACAGVVERNALKMRD